MDGYHDNGDVYTGTNGYKHNTYKRQHACTDRHQRYTQRHTYTQTEKTQEHAVIDIHKFTQTDADTQDKHTGTVEMN